MTALRAHSAQVLSAKAAADATGIGSLDFGVVRAAHTLQVTSGAGVSAGVVTLEASLDNAKWKSLGTVTTNAASTGFFVSVADSPYRYVRARISTVITGGTVDAWIGSA